MNVASFACNLNALAGPERGQLQEIARLLSKAVTSVEEREHGYEAAFDVDMFPQDDAEKWLALERRCCPFLNFQLRPGMGGKYTVGITGTEGAKPFILAEFPALAKHLST